MANEPIDPLALLGQALQLPADSKEQGELLAVLREQLEAHPNPIPILCTTLLKNVTPGGDSLLKRWVLDLLYFAISRSTLNIDQRTQCAFFLYYDRRTILSYHFHSGITIPGTSCEPTSRPEPPHRQSGHTMLRDDISITLPHAVRPYTL